MGDFSEWSNSAITSAKIAARSLQIARRIHTEQMPPGRRRLIRSGKVPTRTLAGPDPAEESHLPASRDRLRQLARYQTALRRVAELVAREAEPAEVLSAVAEEMATVLDVHNATVGRYDGDDIVIAALGRPEVDLPNPPVVGDRFPLDGDHVAVTVRRTRRPARIDSHRHAAGTSANASARWASNRWWACRSWSDHSCGAWPRWPRGRAAAGGHGGRHLRLRGSGRDRNRQRGGARTAEGQPRQPGSDGSTASGAAPRGGTRRPRGGTGGGVQRGGRGDGRLPGRLQRDGDPQRR